ncbi:MAG: lysophospholipid acyltransferase family protein [Bacilli bacterium]
MFHYTKAVLKLGGPIVHGYVSFLRKYAKNEKNIDLKIRYKKIHNLVNKITKGLQSDLFIEGIENIPSGNNNFYAPNHISNYDPLLILSIFDDVTSFVAKQEIKKFPLVGLAVYGIDGLFIDRQDLKQSLKVMMKVEEDLKKQQRSWVIFPEGTRNKDNMRLMLPFHHGTFRAATRARVPIVPVAIYGTFRILKLKPQFKKYPIFIKFLKPITPEEYDQISTQELADLTRANIQRAISFDLRIKDDNYMAKMGKKYKFNASY